MHVHHVGRSTIQTDEPDAATAILDARRITSDFHSSKPKGETIVTVDVVVRHITQRAILVGLDDTIDSIHWLPLSMVEVSLSSDGTATIAMPEWMAIEKGMI